MQKFNHSHFLAQFLAMEPIFRSTGTGLSRGERDYSIFTEVPVRCLSVPNADAVTREFGDCVLDVVVCRGHEVIYAFVFDAEARNMEVLFASYLPALPHQFLRREDFVGFTARSLCRELSCKLVWDQEEPRHTGYKLYVMYLRYVIAKLKGTTVSSVRPSHCRAMLMEKHLLRSSGEITGYGRACGLFRQWPFEQRAVFVTAPQCVDAMNHALRWEAHADEGLPLAARLRRLEQGLPCEAAGQETAILERLLATPLETLFRNHPQDLGQLDSLLTHAQFLTREAKVSAFGDKEEITTYGDVLSVIRNLWQRAEGDLYYSCKDTCQDLLLYLSYPLWSLPGSDEGCEAPLPAEGPQPLHARLLALRQEKVFDISLACMPLLHYFHAAASLTGSEYPLWLHRTSVAPLLAFHGLESPPLYQTMSTLCQLYDSGEDRKRDDCFTLFYDILVEPFSGVV